MKETTRLRANPRKRIGRRLITETLEPRTLLVAKLLMTEVMARNGDTIADEDGDTSDWVEVYNAGSEPVDLAGWYLTDDADELTKWRFGTAAPSSAEDSVLTPGQYRIVFASGKDRSNPASEPHTNFRLSGGGEFLALIQPDGQTVSHQNVFPAQRTDVSYGLQQLDTTREVFFTEPTPGEANGNGVLGFVADTQFDGDTIVFHGRGFYDAPFDVIITSATPGATLVYTTDSSAPGPANGVTVAAADDQSAPKATVSISTTTTLRVMALKEDFAPTNVDTQTYVFADDVIRQPPDPEGYTTAWHSTRQASYGMASSIVNDHLDTIVDDLKSLPTMSLVGSVDDLFGEERGVYYNWPRRGREWERPVSVEYFDPSQPDRQFQVDAGIRIMGRTTRGSHRKSMRLFFRSEYGASKLRFPLFPDSDVDSFDEISLRFNSDRDRFSHQTLRDMGQLAPHVAPVHLYINGMYWGLYFPMETPNHSFSASYLGGDEDEYDALKHAQGLGNPEPFEILNGNSEAWEQMFAIARTDLSDDANYEAIQQILDIDQFIDYLLVNMHLTIGDWPGNNWYATRRQSPDGKFRFYTWDRDQAMLAIGPKGNQMDFTRVTGENDAGELYQSLRTNAHFRRKFGDHVHKHLFNNGALSVAALQARWSALADSIHQAMVPFTARWGTVIAPHSEEKPFTREDSWTPEFNRVLNDVIPERFGFSFEDFREAGLYPLFDAPAFNQHGGKFATDFQLTMDGPGDIYFTTDGTDPSDGFATVAFTLFVDHGSPARAFIPTDDSLANRWTAIDFDDASWPVGEVGVGIELKDTSRYTFRSSIGLDVESDMFDANASAYIRVPFEVTDASTLVQLTLRMKYDDGYVAYLNGVEVARRHAPDDLAWDSRATKLHRDREAVEFEDVDVSDYLPLLRQGANVLAIHGLNQKPGSDDFLVLPQLRGQTIVDARIADQSIRYTEPIKLRRNGVVKARTLFRGEWSALNEASFLAEQAADFDGDGTISAQDIDWLTAEIANPRDQSADLTGDGSVDSSDLDELVLNILRTRYGDVDLDGDVDQADFEVLSVNFGSQMASWSLGDSNGDGDVDFEDFVRLTNSFGF